MTKHQLPRAARRNCEGSDEGVRRLLDFPAATRAPVGGHRHTKGGATDEEIESATPRGGNQP